MLMASKIDDGPLIDDRRAVGTKLLGNKVARKWKWVSTKVTRLTLDWKGLKNVCQKVYLSVIYVYVYHSKIERNNLMLG